MGTISGMLALALLGAEPMPTPTPAGLAQGELIACQARVVTLDGLGWRSAYDDCLDPIGQKGAAMVWVADRSIQRPLIELAGARVTCAPKMMTLPEESNSATSTRTIDYVRIGAAAAAASGRPATSQVEEKLEVRCTAKRLDQGTLAKVRLADLHLATMHKVPAAPDEATADRSGPDAGEVDATVQVERIARAIDAATNAPVPTSGLLRLAGMVADTIDAKAHNPVAFGAVEVPEVVAATVEGEWLVADDSVLVVSLGVRTVADAQGRAVVQDRVAILDFSDQPMPAAAAMAPAEVGVIRVCEASGPAPAAIAVSHLNMPAVPGRSLPEALDGEGRVVDLPPLPEAYAANVNQISPGSPLASPQSALAASAAAPRPMVDLALARTSFEAPAAPQPSRLAALIEGFLRSGMEARARAGACCPAEGCPAEACPGAAASDDEAPECPAQGSCPFAGAAPATADKADATPRSVRATFAAALQNPGTAETQFVPLGKGLALEVRVRVVPAPSDADDAGRAGEPGQP